MNQPALPLVTVALLLPAFAACLGSTPATTATETPKPFAGQTLTILDQGAFPAFSKLQQPFQNLTGAKLVKLGGGDAGNALRQALLSAGNPVADVLYGVDNALFFSQQVRDKNLYVAYESPNLRRINRTLIDVDQFRVGGDLWATPVDHGYISPNYDIKLRDAHNASELPATLRDLATTTWAPRFVTEDPRSSSPGLGFLLASIDTFGETGGYSWKAFWKDLLHNGTLVANDWTSAYVYHYAGGYGSYDDANAHDRSVVVSYTTSPAVEVYFSPGSSPPGVSVEPAYGVFHQIETMGILRGSTHIGLAQAWIDFCLTDEFQRLAAPELAVYPVVDGIALPPEFTQYATDPGRLEPARLRAPEIGPNLDRWLAEWTSIYQAERA